jgi:hypothetical protein
VSRALILALVVALLVGGLATGVVLRLRGDGDEASKEPIRVTSPAITAEVYSTGAGTAQPVARLPGITVLGFGEA